MSTQLSLKVTPISGGHAICGFTFPIRQQLIDCGAVWNTKLIQWEVPGKVLPECVKSIIAGLSELDVGEKPIAVEKAANRAESRESSTVFQWKPGDSINRQNGHTAVVKVIDGLFVHAILTFGGIVSEQIISALSFPERTFGNYAPGRYAWKLELVEVFSQPIPAKGAQRLWDWERPRS